jgi:hypothetical protein
VVSDRRFIHAPDNAPLYRVSEAIGGLAWPAYCVWEEGPQARVTLDINGSLVSFFATDVIEVARPEGLPDWVLDMLAAVRAYEELHGHTADGWDCFASLLGQVPEDAMDYVNARKQVERPNV